MTVFVLLWSIVRRTLFLSSCGVELEGHFMTCIVCIPPCDNEVESKCEGTPCDAY